MDRLVSAVYPELREIARRQLRRRSPQQTLDTTALVHEAYLRISDRFGAGFESRHHFYAVMGVVMRRMLVDAARKRAAQKRGGAERNVTFDDLIGAGELPAVDVRTLEILSVDQALVGLAEHDPRLGRVVELLYFGGMTETETARALGVSDRTVRRDWLKARAFLALRLGTGRAA